jgi:hypothetical protein
MRNMGQLSYSSIGGSFRISERLGLKGITERAMSTIIKYQGIGHLYRVYALTKLDGWDFNVAVIPDDFKVEGKEEFDKNYMNQIFNLGYGLGSRGYAWMKSPAGLKQAVEADKVAPSGKASVRKSG